METRARKRARVSDYNDDDGVAERATKRAKKENVKQEVKTEIKKEIKSEPATSDVKKEQKIKIKSEIKRDIKAEVSKDEKEKTIKPEQNNGIISRIVSYAKSFLFPDNDIHEIESDEPNESIPTTQNNQTPESNEPKSSSSSSESSSSESEDESSEEADVLFADKAKYNFDSFKTILLPRKKALKWPKATNQHKMHLNSDIIAVIISFSEFPQITIWTRVSKSTSNLVHAAQSQWKKFFREREWRLPHEIRNKCFRFESQKPIPQLQISDDNVDWFSEFQRNYKTCSKIRRIVTKLMLGHRPEPDVKKVKEKIARWEKSRNYFMPNDMREYYMCSPSHGLLLPSLNEIRPFTTDMHPPKITMNDFYSIEPDGYEEESKPDMNSLSKLLDVPKSKLTEHVYDILYLEDGRSDCTVFVPYLNRIYSVEDNGLVNYYDDQGTILQGLIKSYQRYIYPG